MIWDKGVWAPIAQDRLGDAAEADRQLAKGELKFVLLGKKLLGSWVLVRTRGTRQWLLIKHRDEYASGEDLTVTQPRSVVSNRTLAEIGRAAGASPRQLQQAQAADPATSPPRVPARRPAAPTPARAARSGARPRRAVGAASRS
jgi:bifunctional non-homologous end joining protein LigD